VTIRPADPLQLARHVATILESLDIPYSIGGSLAGSFAGKPRATLGIDVVVDVPIASVTALARALDDQFYVDAGALRRAVNEGSTTSVIHRPTSIKVDLFIAGGTALDRDLLQRRRSVRIGAGEHDRVWVHSPEDILLQKLRWFRRSGDASDRQWRDVLGILRAQAGRLDRDYLASGGARLEVSDLLDRAIREVEALP
jgi:hypothetical protein